MTRSRATTTLTCALLLAAGAGCGILKSSTSQGSAESSSKSSSSPIRSSSRSVGDAVRAALERDVGDYSAAYAEAPTDPEAFLRDVGSITRRHGVVDWEVDAGVHRAMGRGFRRGGLDVGRARTLAATITGRDRTRVGWLLAGHASDGAP